MIKKRLFIGIPLTDALVKRLRRERAHWDESVLIPVRDMNLHVTLLFLGFVDENMIEEICEGIEEAVSAVSAFEMSFQEIRLTPSDNPSMIWLEGEALEELRLLRENLEQSLGYILPPRKSFRPHVNLASIRKKPFALLENKDQFSKKVHLVEPVESVVLFESTVIEGKRQYAPLREFPLE